MSAGGRRVGAGRPKGSLNKATMVGRDALQRLASLMESALDTGTKPERLIAALKRTLKDKPEAYLATYVAVLKHLAPPARAPEPGTEDRPMVIEVRSRGGEDEHASEVASAAAHLRRGGYTNGDDDGE